MSLDGCAVLRGVAIGALGFFVTAVASASASPIARVGCHGDWPVVAHHANGAIANVSGRRPIACAAPTGFPTSETTIAVAPNGTLFFSPANSENSLAQSPNQGASWYLVSPQSMQLTALWNTVDPDVIADRRTGRVFWVRATGDLRTTPILVADSPLGWQTATAIAYAHGFQVYSTDNGGQSWVTADYQHEFTGDWEKIYVGPPAAGAPQPSGYPDVVYMCANAPLEVSGPGRACYRSLDGGQTFSDVGYVLPTTSSPHDVCPPLAGGAGGGVGSDGAFYQPQSCELGSWVAVSHDEGATYSWFPITGAPGVKGLTSGLQLAVDYANDLYALWTNGTQLQLAISRDGGRTWDQPLAVAAPGLKQIDLPALSAGPSGHVALTYYGSSDASAQRLTAYLTETADALGRQPVFYSAALNDPAQPIFHDYGGTDTPRADFLGITYDSSGNPWAGVVKQLGAPDAQSRVATTGYVGTLEPAPTSGVPTRCTVRKHVTVHGRRITVCINGPARPRHRARRKRPARTLTFTG